MEIRSPILMFSFMMFVILFAPLIFARLRMPGIVGLIIAGIAIGPYGLGMLRPEGAFKLFSSVGLLYIMFLAGLEINLHEFSRQKKFSLVFGFLTFFIPMLVGTFGARGLFSFSWPCSVLLASMFASHTLIPFPIISRLGLNRQRAVVATVGGTIITDTAALLVLAITVEWFTTNLTAVFMARQIFFLAVLVWFALWVLPRIAYLFFRIFPPDGSAEFLSVLALVFLTSHFSRLAGVEPIIGAFFAGLALSRIIAEKSPLMNRLEFVGNTLFIPFFLVSVGMLVDLRVLVSGWDVWKVALFMVAAVMFCKYAAAAVFERAMKFTADERNLMFGLSVNQAAATLAAVIVGLRVGIFNEAILNGTILMILVTCVVGPWFTERYGRNIARTHIKKPDHVHRGDKRIMVALGRDESAKKLTDVALSLRDKSSQEPLFPLVIVQDGLGLDRRIAFGEKVLSESVAYAVSASVPVSPISRIDVNVSGGIMHALKEWHIDTLVMGAAPISGGGLRSALFSVYDKICDESDQMVFMCRMDHSPNMDKNLFVLVPPMLECQPGFRRALQAVKSMAAGNKIRIHVMGMSDTVRHIEGIPSEKGSTAEISFSAVEHWKDFPTHLKNRISGETDAVVLMAAKKGRMAWHPYLKHLYHSLREGFPKNNVILVHPADSDYLEEAGRPFVCEPETGDTGSFRARSMVEVKGSSLEEVVKEILATQFPPDSRTSAAMVKQLMALDPVWLSSEIALLHTHSAVLDEPVILLGVHPHGVGFPGSGHKARAVFVLISPKDSTSVHLQALTEVARMAHGLQVQNGWHGSATEETGPGT